MWKRFAKIVGLPCLLVLPLISPGLLHAKELDKSSPMLASYSAFVASTLRESSDTFLVAGYTFDSPGGSCTSEGWKSVDLTAQLDTMFHVDDFQPIEGLHSLWCGARADSVEPWCSWGTLPGYGNMWNQYWESDTFMTSGQTLLSFLALYDCEPGYDYAGAEYYDFQSQTWQSLINLSGSGQGRYEAMIPKTTDPGPVRARLYFRSDGAYSDEDGLYDGLGMIVDSLMLSSAETGVVDIHDFEIEPVGATQTLDGDWRAEVGDGFGDFAGLFPGVAVPQCDPCTTDPSCLWAFFKGSPDYTIACNGDSVAAIPFGHDGMYLRNEIWSPWIDITTSAGGQPIPSDASGVFEFWLYDDLPLENLVFYVWHLRTRSGPNGCPGPWKDRNLVYYIPTGNKWRRIVEPVGDLLNPGDDYVQLAIGVWDMCCLWGGYPLNHSYTPLVDNVRFYRVLEATPAWLVRNIDLFQDGFPTNGTTIGTVRCDAGLTPQQPQPSNLPRDYITMTVSDPGGLDTGPDGRAAVYVYVRVSPGPSPPQSWEAPEPGRWHPKRWPFIDGPTAGGFYRFQCDTLYADEGVSADGFCFDLNDNFFTPPDRIDFYFSATNTLGQTTYWSRKVGTTSSQAEVEAYPMEMQCLPTGNSDILYVDVTDGVDGDVSQRHFDIVFENLNIKPDRYDKRGLGAGLGSRAAMGQIIDVYHKIIWSSGHLNTGTIGDGSGNPEYSPDAQLLFHFLDQSSLWNPGLYLTGDNISEEMHALGSSPIQNLLSYISHSLIAGDHVAYGLPVSPLVAGLMPNTIFKHVAMPPSYPDTMIVYGGECPDRNGFDVMAPTGSALTEMYYQADPSAGAVIGQETVNAQGFTARVILEGFSFEAIRDDKPNVPYDRADHLVHILEWFDNTVVFTGTSGVPLVSSLEQNYPNPFNPQTTIRFGIAKKGFVTLKIYNVAGQLVKTLQSGLLEPRIYEVVWDGRDDKGEPVASGVYFCRLVAKDFAQTRKMVVLK